MAEQAITQEQATSNFEAAEDRAIMAGASFDDINAIRTRAGLPAGEVVESAGTFSDAPVDTAPLGGAGAIIDPISGLSVSPFVQPEVFLDSANKKTSHLRALLDIRGMNDPEEDIETLYRRTKSDVDKGISEELMQDELLSYSAKKEQEALEIVQQATSLNPESVQISVNILEGIGSIREQFSDMDGYYQAVADYNAPNTIAGIRAQENAVKGRGYQILENLTETVGTLDVAINWASLLASDFIKDASDLVDGSIFTSVADVNRAIKDFQTRSPDEQAVLIEDIVPTLWKAYDENHIKVGAMLATLFNKSGSGTDLVLGTMFDAFVVGDTLLIAKAAKSIVAARSLATRAIDTDGIESAARRQAIAGVKDPDIEAAIGVKPIDAAHSANPMPTRVIDEGASIDGIAGEIELVKAQKIKMLEEQLLPVAGNKLDRGVMKKVFRDKNLLQKNIAQLTLEKAAITGSKGGAKVAQGRKVRVAEINADIAIMEERLAITQRTIDANVNAVQAEATLSRLQQGIIPDNYRASMDAAVEEAKVVMRETKEVLKAAPRVVAKNESEQNIEAVQSLGSVQHVKEEVNRLVEDIITPAAFSPEETARAITKAQERLNKELTDAGQEINSMDVIARDSTGFSIRYTTTSGNDQRVFKFTKDDVGSVVSENEARTFKQKWQNLFGRVFSPEVLLENVFPDLVANTTFAGQQTAKFRNGLSALWKESEKGLNKQDRFEVDSILMAGDEEGKIYSIAELREGLVETQNGVIKMSPKQIDSYYQKRTFFDELHRMRELATKRQLEIEGYENLRYAHTTKGTVDMLGRRRDTFDLRNVGADDLVLFPGEAVPFHKGSVVSLKKDFYKDDGYQVVELFQPVKTKAGKEVKIALVKRDSAWREIPDNTLHYQPGYVPRIYPRGYFYVRDMASVNNEVLYAFPTKETATAWSRAQPDTAVFADREFNAIERLVEDSNAYGGLYTGARKTRPLMVVEGSNVSDFGPVSNLIRPERMSVGNATERYVQNISSIMPLNEYRATTMETWKNTVDNMASAQGRSGLGHEHRFDSAIDLEKDSKNVMEQSRQYIQENMGMPSREERVTERMALGAANMMYGKPFASKPRQWLLDHSQGSVSDWMKGVSFNLHMGFFNLRQLFMQAQNASLSISMNPTLALPAMGEALKLRSIAMLPESKAGMAAKHMSYDSDITQSLREYNKSGMRDSIVRQADFDVNSAGIAHGSLDVARQLSKKGRVFFNEGENFSRLVSWSIARRKWKTANPSKKLDDKAIIEVSQDALRMQLNLQSENASWWQKAPGINVATQFLQVQAKFLENAMPQVLGGSAKWSAQEKRRALAGQLFLYGVVGVPVAEEAVSYAAELAGLSTVEFMEQNPGFTDSVNEGFIGMIGSLLGAEDISASASFNLLAGIDDNVVWSLAEGAIDVFNGGYSEEGAIEMFTGPSANIIRRVGDVAGGLVLSMKTIYGTPSMEVAYQAVMSNLDDIAAMTSTWTNARKLATLHNTDRLMSSRGTLVATSEELGTLSWQTQLGITMGFPTDIEVSHYANKNALKGAQQYTKDTLKDLKKSLIQFSNTGNMELYEAKKAVLLSPFSPTERIKLLQSVNKDALSPTSSLDRDLKAAQRLILESNGRVKPNVAQSNLLREEQL